ncbi:diaminobutyrate acetyltransferase [Paracoccus sp. MBLB3053]|uniref:L-2,4-diaminobutyric acid acetyltransferase n=1 Tax=Paracoccus aurantius TaxID=3073814 RepID=A0ABU2HVZ3_9RHOB|nr:diaminobutyrate acetyltransferase [Paracoccus sp. MBLB3053]MDS9469226.1 diaminobutyrate acetyltransferase [Paracoccus sp. MBLB3053]
MTTVSQHVRPSGIALRTPGKSDGSAVWQLIADSGSLDENSLYCNLLQCSHFAQTCVLAEMDGKPVGWLSGYIPPEQPDTYFVWQICVSPQARGLGLARHLITEALNRSACRNVNRLECTITPDNAASWGLFKAMARVLGAPLGSGLHFDCQHHFDNRHASEHLVSIGPFDPAERERLRAA